MGDIKVHHFAHSRDACDEVIAYTSGLYKLIHQILSDGTPFYIPELAISYRMTHELLDDDSIGSYVRIVRNNKHVENVMTVSKGKNVSFENVLLSFDSKNNIQAIELTCMGRKMAIKVMPPDTVCKYSSVSPYKNMATLVLDFTDDADIIQKSNSGDFRKHLFSEKLNKYWISNPLVRKVFPELLEINKKLHEEYLEQQRKRELENKLERELKRKAALDYELKRKAALEQKKLIDEAKKASAIEQRKRRDDERKIAKQNHVSAENAKGIAAYDSVKDKFVQQDDIITDCYGNRWVQCEICGEIMKDSEFWTYGGVNRTNLGQFYSCSSSGQK